MKSPLSQPRLTPKRLVELTVEHYLGSADFNGLSLSKIFGSHFENRDWVKAQLRPLIQAGRLTVRVDSVDVNPFIKRRPDFPPETELKRLDEWNGGVLVAYPTRIALEQVVDRTLYRGRPFGLELALGAAHLDFKSFDLGVLEQYRNDPRYYYQVSDYKGYISVHDEHYLGTEMKESDKVLLPHFGFAYDEAMNRAVAVFLTDLHKLTPEHQQIWHARILEGSYRLHPIFLETTVQGIWSKDSVITTAFLWELHRINECCAVIGKPPLFRKDYWQAERPKNFCFLIRPTAKEFADFCGTLDKLMSDNINRAFFKGEVNEKSETVRKDGKIEIVTKGTITLLKEWLAANWKPKTPIIVESMLGAFKEVRAMRNPSAHANLEDIFDRKYFQQQRLLLGKAFGAVRTLRLVFESHPTVQAGKQNFPEEVRNVLDY